VTLIGGPRSILRFPTLSGPGEAEAFIAGRVAEGVDYIKVFIEDGSFWGRSRQVLSPESVHTVIAAAYRHGKQVLVHADGGASVRLALDAGADALAHHPNDADPAGDITGRLATGRRFVIPTLTIPAAFAPGRRGHEGGNDDLLGHPRLGPYLDARTWQIMTAPPPPPPPAAPKNFTRVGLDFTGVLDITGCTGPESRCWQAPTPSRSSATASACTASCNCSWKSASPRPRYWPPPPQFPLAASALPTGAASAPGCAPTCCSSTETPPPASPRHPRHLALMCPIRPRNLPGAAGQRPTSIRRRMTPSRGYCGRRPLGRRLHARIITGAALIIVAVFAGFARGDPVMFQQMGFGVAISLLIDATITAPSYSPARWCSSATATGTSRPGSTGPTPRSRRPHGSGAPASLGVNACATSLGESRVPVDGRDYPNPLLAITLFEEIHYGWQ
jgi:hypothetical protein